MEQIDMPVPLGRYFAAQNAHDIDAIVACFAADAVVQDEGRTITGLAAVRTWKEAASTKYRITVEPLRATRTGDQAEITARVSGNFPGSPANLTYVFGLSADHKIRTLSVR